MIPNGLMIFSPTSKSANELSLIIPNLIRENSTLHFSSFSMTFYAKCDGQAL